MLEGSILVNYMMHILVNELEEDNLQCLCTLLRKIGGQLDKETELKLKYCLDACFHRLNNDVQQKMVGARVRFLIQDILDMRIRGWTIRDRQGGNNSTAIGNIHAEEVGAEVLEDLDTEEMRLINKFKDKLKQIRPKKYDKIMEEIDMIKIDTEERLTRVLDLGYYRAALEPSFSSEYYDFCTKLLTLTETFYRTISKGSNSDLDVHQMSKELNVEEQVTIEVIQNFKRSLNSLRAGKCSEELVAADASVKHATNEP